METFCLPKSETRTTRKDYTNAGRLQIQLDPLPSLVNAQVPPLRGRVRLIVNMTLDQRIVMKRLQEEIASNFP